MKSPRARMDILAAFHDLGSFRAAAALCGTTDKTVKRVVLRQQQGPPPPRQQRRHNTAVAVDVVREKIAATDGRISAKRLLPLARTAGYTGSARNLYECVGERHSRMRRTAMRGDDPKAASVWSYVPIEARVPRDHPLRPIREMTDRALRELDPVFRRLYARTGRPSVPPERLLRALLLQLLYSLRSERLLMERLDTDLLFRWFVGLAADDPIWDVTVFTKNRERLLCGEVAQRFFAAVLGQARERELLSDEHFQRRRHARRGVGGTEERPTHRPERARPLRRRGGLQG